MVKVGLRAGPETAPALAEALTEAGFTPVAGEAPVLAVEAGEMEADEVRRLVRFVVDGGVLAVLGGRGPLQAALHLTPGDEVEAGPVEPAWPDLPAVDVAEARPVTGVGYSLYRAGGRSVAVAGPRGDGWVVYLADARPRLAASCLRWAWRRLSCV